MNWQGDQLLARAVLRFRDAEIEAAIQRIAAEVTDRCAGRNPVVIAVMLGAMPFTTRLIGHLAFQLQLDYAHLSRYRGTTLGGGIEWIRSPSMSLAGRQVLILDDVLDEGHTLHALLEWCRAQDASEVLSAVLVRKRCASRPEGMRADFIGLEADERYLFGFGMDYQERYRHLPDIRALPLESLDD